VYLRHFLKTINWNLSIVIKEKNLGTIRKMATSTCSQVLIIGLVALMCVVLVSSVPRNKNKIYTVNRWYALPGYSETPFSDCGSKGATIQKVEVIPCDNDHACQLKTGTNATFKITFVPKVNTTTFRARIHGIVAGIPLPFHCPQENACENSNISCPIIAGNVYHYVVQLPVLNSYPHVNVKVKWELLSSVNQDVVCVLVPAKLI